MVLTFLLHDIARMFGHHVAMIVFKILLLSPNNASCVWKFMGPLNKSGLGRPKSFSFAIPLPIWNLKASHWKEFHILFEA